MVSCTATYMITSGVCPSVEEFRQQQWQYGSAFRDTNKEFLRGQERRVFFSSVRCFDRGPFGRRLTGVSWGWSDRNY